MPVLTYLWILPVLPLLGAAANGIFGRNWPKSIVTGVALSSTTLAFISTLELVREFVSLPPDQIPFTKSYFTWIAAGGFRADFALQVDQLTVIMLLVVTGVGWLIHIYSSGYMHDDPGYTRFFSYLNLFMFFMLLLVLAANYLLMFVGWEGVGLCSYLLIGFFFLKQSATNAGNKAFWVNRIGDFGFILGVLLILRTFGTLDFATVFPKVAAMPAEPLGQVGVLTTIALLLFVGAAGKSAQLPLYVWLPDAMEGPTPVSALIHAATMVTAGVYMVVRSHSIFLNAPTAMQVVAVIGCVTALFAATIGLVQTDIKKVLAYSTVSQLGYMFLACGVGAFSAGIFHLMTHAFFKGLLFLAAGSVIHAMGGEQDMRKMGGLRKKIPWTFWTMFIATLAIAGTPGFSGFFSKDEILLAAQRTSTPLWALGILTAGLTSFYMFRLLFLTFFGAPRFDEHKVHVHESPRNMTVPLVVLAILALGGGWMAAPHLLGGPNYFDNFLSPVLSSSSEPAAASAEPAGGASELVQVLFGAPVIAGLLGFLLAWWFYIRSPKTPKKLAESLSAPYKLLSGKYFVDELYSAVIVRPLVWISDKVLWHTVDEGVIDGTVNGVARVSRETGDRLRYASSGNVRSYAAWVVLGAVVFTSLLLWMAGYVLQQTYVLTVLTFLPVAGTLALLLLRSEDHVWIRRLALVTAVAEFAISLLLLRGFDSAATGYQFEEFHNWIAQPPIHYHLGVDGLSLFLILLTTVLTPISILASWKSIDQRVKGFFISLLVLETGVIGVFVSLDLFLFFLFWEVMLIPMYFLIGIWGHERRIYAALKFVLYTMFGSILMLVAILWLYRIAAVAGYTTFDLAQIQMLLSNGTFTMPVRTEMLLFGAFFLAFAIKVPLFPLHTWLPDAHTEAPTAGSVMLAGVLLKMGTYGMLRFCLPLFPEASRRFAPWIAILAITGIIYGALVAMVQVDLKRLVAYSSVSHLGFVVLGIFAFHAISIQGAVFQMLAHGIATGALFLGVGMLYDRRHTHLIKEFGGLATPMPVLAALYLFTCFASAGLPMLNGFVGEFLILAGTFQKHAAWASWAALGVIFSAVYLLWSYQRVYFGAITQEKNRSLPDADIRERGILFVMAVLILWMGIGSPFFTRRTEASSQNVLQLMQRPQAYNAGGIHNHEMNIDADHSTVPAGGAISSASNGANDAVKSK